MRKTTIISEDTGKVVVDSWTMNKNAESNQVSKSSHLIARCRPCGIAFGWKKNHARLADLNCLFCGSRVSQTTLALQQSFWVLSVETVDAMAVGTEDDRRARVAILTQKAEDVREHNRIQREAKHAEWQRQREEHGRRIAAQRAEDDERRRITFEHDAIVGRIASNDLVRLADEMRDAVRDQRSDDILRLARSIDFAVKDIERGRQATESLSRLS